ncbi:hypothetical protein CAPTEDRAFT_219365 [Capitella teleta]|uniref:Uncharacterized protein n=1 Tax=Capitella teleta TaxID=283909 RepID=R7TFI4_CAPTE|nr:hypothetical protein CAPTEDRAFT_219365 [Capitella teleta]|eukprot:ELT92543.1 hypothetical protein CAPTEDRAFT_219365 [Capitella teleta]
MWITRGCSLQMLVRIGRHSALNKMPSKMCSPCPTLVFRPFASLPCSDARPSSFEECQELLRNGDKEKLREIFLRRMLEIKGSTLRLEHCLHRLRRLEEMGLKWYEIVEGPSLMEVEEYMIQRKLKYLEAAGYERISIRMLHLMNPRRSNASLCTMQKWLNQVNPCISIAEHITRRLTCSENDIICLYFTQMKRKNFSSKSIESLIDKFILMHDSGFSVREISTHGHLLHHVTYKSLEKRLKSEPQSFIEVINTQPMKELSQLLCISEENLQDSELITTHGDSVQHLRKLLERVKVLLRAGYDATEVRNYLETCSSRTLFRESSSKYAESLAQLKAEGLTASSGLDLRALGIHSRRKQLLQEFRARRPNRYDIAKSLNCHFSEIKSKLPREKLFSRGFNRSHISKNFDFLLECGFSDDVIKRLPSVICVNPKVLRESWDCIINEPRFSHWKANHWTLVNVLLYFAEKRESHPHESCDNNS